jgi:chemotaxis protein methyltransferase CheR
MRLAGPMEPTTRQSKTLRDMVYKECGINLHKGKEELLKARLAKRLRITKIDSVDKYMKLIREDEGEFLNFIDAVSTNHTFFFRENHHCEFILKNLKKSDYLKIWSAASSSGEEPYAVAVQLLERGFRFQIFASDISNAMLNLARRGVYNMGKVKLVPPQILRKYFQKGCGKWEGYVRVKREVKHYVEFGRHNLVTDSSPGLFDIIFCRNVMIYFDNRTRQRVIDHLYGSLEHGGYLILGAAEGLVGSRHQFKYTAPSMYRKS